MKELNCIVEELQEAVRRLELMEADSFVAAMKMAKRIFVYGTGRSGLMLKAFAMRLMQLDYEVYVIGETITPSVGKGDLLIVASASGETESVCRTVRFAQGSGASVVTITADSASRMAKIQKPLIVIESATKFSLSKASVQPLGSLFEQMLLLLLDGISMRIGFMHKNGNVGMAKRHANIE
ncbi:6-phospho-3-hexuloisomerase [Sporomusaceae bacterium BoRhaA]|uniref:6-phospho-3-hexuloisomerase n=1 Tax=Pelorhabdus rhamnosifermentans TaxID=2772457 RepID=UPI001C063329|nr:6-phospho-3-hexuloisomerase [Pelorhabdus rhamnosifermentans]MBU2701317.1 6-phospho-3-hexuloisomerase [Pelorhabdus rhamnosifermentans]